MSLCSVYSWSEHNIIDSLHSLILFTTFFCDFSSCYFLKNWWIYKITVWNDRRIDAKLRKFQTFANFTWIPLKLWLSPSLSLALFHYKVDHYFPRKTWTRKCSNVLYSVREMEKIEIKSTFRFGDWTHNTFGWQAEKEKAIGCEYKFKWITMRRHKYMEPSISIFSFYYSSARNELNCFCFLMAIRAVSSQKSYQSLFSSFVAAGHVTL